MLQIWGRQGNSYAEFFFFSLFSPAFQNRMSVTLTTRHLLLSAVQTLCQQADETEVKTTSLQSWAEDTGYSKNKPNLLSLLTHMAHCIASQHQGLHPGSSVLPISSYSESLEVNLGMNTGSFHFLKKIEISGVLLGHFFLSPLLFEPHSKHSISLQKSLV